MDVDQSGLLRELVGKSSLGSVVRMLLLRMGRRKELVRLLRSRRLLQNIKGVNLQ